MTEYVVSKHILFYAFRYALGRKTYVVGDVVSELITQWTDINEHDRSVYKKEIRAAIENDCAGMEIDVFQWKRILELE